MRRLTERTGLRALLWLPAVLWYGVIWRLSDQTAAVSGALSDRLLFRLLGLLSPGFAALPPLAQGVLVELLSFYERKAAHMLAYFLLALLLCLPAARRLQVRIVRALALCAVLAAVDEVHQRFIPGRSGEFRDVCVDLCGSTLGLLALLLILAALSAQRHPPRRRPLGVLLLPGVWAGLLLAVLCSENLALHPIFYGRLGLVDTPDFWALTPPEREALLLSLSPTLREVLALLLCAALAFFLVCAAALWGLPPKRVLPTLYVAVLAGMMAVVLGGLPLAETLVFVLLGLSSAGLIWAAAQWVRHLSETLPYQ